METDLTKQNVNYANNDDVLADDDGLREPRIDEVRIAPVIHTTHVKMDAKPSTPIWKRVRPERSKWRMWKPS